MEKKEDLKKGSWQTDYNTHIEIYGDRFMDVKNFSLNIDDYILHNHIEKFWQSCDGQCDVYEFGVYTGGTLRDISNKLDMYNISPRKIWGFDSFEGLPKETEGMLLEGMHWNEGAFSASDALGVWDWETLENILINKINKKNVELIKGFYHDTLNNDLFIKKDFKPAMFINIDVDLYRSTIDVLKWMFSNKLVKTGTVIRYDDVSYIPEDQGELKAHVEMCEMYKITYHRINKEYFLITNTEYEL